MPYQLAICLVLAVIFEPDVLNFDLSLPLIALIALTCLVSPIIPRSCICKNLSISTCFKIAIAVNVLTYALIGKTSPVTYQVVGHFKTCLTLLFGFVLFPESIPKDALFINLAGVSVALTGIFLYGNVKIREAEGLPDYLDKMAAKYPKSLSWFTSSEYKEIPL